MTTARLPDLRQAAQQGQDLLAVGRVEVAGRLVAQDRLRLGDQGAGDGDALHLAAGHLLGEVLGAVAQADAVQGGARPPARPGLRLWPASSSGRATFSAAVSVGSRLKN